MVHVGLGFFMVISVCLAHEIDPNTEDVFNFNIGNLKARYVKRREQRFPPSSGEALNAQLGANLVKLLTKPRRVGAGPELGFEVAGILGMCSLESLSEFESVYVSAYDGAGLPVSL